MTGFARQDGAYGDTSWTWEFRSVNGKSLDIRLRLPQGFERLETLVKKRCSAELSRGNVQANLAISSGAGGSVPKVNEAVLETVLQAVQSVDEAAKTTPSSAAEILSIRGVMEMSDPVASGGPDDALDKALLDSLADALKALNVHRADEGKALAGFLGAQLDEVERLTKAAESDPSRSTEAILERLKDQVERIMGASETLDRDRLHQEAATLAAKADIREELDRLTAHIESARSLLKAGSPVGRKLEFLAQEFNREANTLCSKSNAISVTEIGLALKVVIDQMREQVLNVE